MASARSLRTGRKRVYSSALQPQDQQAPESLTANVFHRDGVCSTASTSGGHLLTAQLQSQRDVESSQSSHVKMEMDLEHIDDMDVIPRPQLTNETDVNPGVAWKRKIQQSTPIKDDTGDQKYRIEAYQRASRQHDERVRTLEGRIHIGEHGLGGLIQQLHEIQLAIERREIEIRQLGQEISEEKRNKHECEIMIQRLQAM